MNLAQELLRTLSFFEPMTLEYILLDLDKSFLDTYDKLTTKDLLVSLQHLEKKKLIKKIKQEEQISWIRIQPRKSLKRRIREILKL